MCPRVCLDARVAHRFGVYGHRRERYGILPLCRMCVALTPRYSVCRMRFSLEGCRQLGRLSSKAGWSSMHGALGLCRADIQWCRMRGRASGRSYTWTSEGGYGYLEETRTFPLHSIPCATSRAAGLPSGIALQCH